MESKNKTKRDIRALKNKIEDERQKVLFKFVAGVVGKYDLSVDRVKIYAKDNCKSCYGRGYITFDDCKTRWQQPCACVERYRGK